MAALRFDQGLRFDTGLTYDAPTPPPAPGPVLPRNRLMSNFKLELSRKSIDEKITLGQNHITSMTGNTLYPAATRTPTDAQFQTAQDDLVSAHQAVQAAETAWKAAIQARDVKEAAGDASLTARAANCEAVTPGDRAALATTGLPLRTPPSSVGLVDAPRDLRAEMGKNTGTIDLRWQRVRGATSYIVECMEHAPGNTWAPYKTITRASLLVTGLVSGKTYAFRVRALGTMGEGPWSDEAVRMAP